MKNIYGHDVNFAKTLFTHLRKSQIPKKFSCCHKEKNVSIHSFCLYTVELYFKLNYMISIIRCRYFYNLVWTFAIVCAATDQCQWLSSYYIVKTEEKCYKCKSNKASITIDKAEQNFCRRHTRIMLKAKRLSVTR